MTAYASCEEKYGTILEMIGDIVYKISPDGIFEFLNGSVRNLGYEAEELIGQHFRAILHPDYVDAVCRENVLARYTGTVTGPERAPKLFDERRSGARMTKNLEIKLIPKGWHEERDESQCIICRAVTLGEVSAAGQYEKAEPDGRARYAGTVGLIRDITSHVRTQETLEESEKRFREMTDLLPMPVFEMDNSGRLIFVNRAMFEMFGFTPADLADGVNIFQCIVHDDWQKTKENIDRRLRGEDIAVCEYMAKRRDGTTFPVILQSGVFSGRGASAGIRGVVIDISEIKLAQKAIRASEEKYRDIANMAPIGISEFDRSGKLTFVNTTLQEWSGYTESEVKVGINILDLVVPKDRERLKEDMGQILVLDSSPPAEYTLIRKDGSIIEVLAIIRPVVARGQVQGFRGILLDFTEKRKMEFAIQNASKLESLGILAGGIAHDFNNFLSGIFGYVNLARFESKEKNVIAYLDAMLNTLNRARALTNQLLTFAMEGIPITKTETLYPFIQETALFALSGSNVACHFAIQEGLWAANFDKNQIAQVIDNIIINAQQAMPFGGIIEVSAKNLCLGEKEHAVLSEGKFIKISFKDRGHGIPQKILPHIFDPFFTTKPKGHGFGLPTCYSIIKRHGGAIDVESVQDEGSTFHIYLPASTESIIVDATSDIKHKGSGTIIVMDDDEAIRATMKNILGKMGYSVECKNDGREALDFFIEETKAKHDISGLILDLTVPGGMGGKEAVLEIRKLDTEIPVFVASGYADDPVMKHPVEHGFMASICKPFRISALSEMLNKYMHA